MIRYGLIDLVHLTDGARLVEIYARGVQASLTREYGDAPWARAYRQIAADWASYFADLDYGGEEGMADMREGYYRVARALFTLTRQPEPEQPQLTALARTLAQRAPTYGDAFTETGREHIETTRLTLIALSYHWGDHARAIIAGAGLNARFQAVVGADTVERYTRDTRYFQLVCQHCTLEPAQCLLIEPDARIRQSAARIGIHTAPDLTALQPFASA